MKPLRVAYLAHYAELYGASRSLLALVIAARDQGELEPLVILACDGPLRVLLNEHGIANAVVPFTTWMHKRVFSGGPHHRLMQRWRYHRAAVSRKMMDRAVLPELIRHCRAHQVQLVHVNSAVIGVGGPLARTLGVPLVWHIRELPFLHYGFTVDGGAAAYRTELQRAQAILALSTAVAKDVASITGNEDRIHVVPNGVISEERWTSLANEATARWSGVDAFVFMHIGLFHPSKGQLEALEAFADVHRELPHTRLIFVGGGRDQQVVERVSALQLGHVVEFAGVVDDPFTALRSAHVLLQCSQHEAFGRVTLEAMAAGVPVIGHASGATRALIQPGINGAWYLDHKELVAAMQAAINDPEECERMGMAGRNSIPGAYTNEAMVHRTLAVYNTVMQQR